MLTLLIIVVAGLGVLNTVALQIRERAHDIGVFKALGMTPRQTLDDDRLLGRRHRPGRRDRRGPGRGRTCTTACSRSMAHAANSGYPPSLISVYSVPELTGLALAGLLIAVAGALAPAGWAARSRTASALRTE